MKLSHFSCICAVAMAASASLVFAQNNQNNSNVSNENQNTSDQMAGTAGGTTAGNTGADLKNDVQAKKIIAPQSVMLHTDLMAARANIQGLMSSLQLSEAKPDATFLNQVKSFDRNIDNTLRDATHHESNLKTSLMKNYPQVASADDVKNLDFSINDLQSFYKSWSSKAKDRSYWQDKDQARADLDSLQKRLDKAIDQSKTFNADQFDIAVG